MSCEAGRPGRILIVLPYWDFWASAVAYDLRAERQALLEAASSALSPWVEVIGAVTVASREDGQAIRPDTADALLVLQTMAVPPAYTLAALDTAPHLPVVIWALHRRRDVPRDFDHAAITAEGATVGTPMLTSALVRSGRRFELVLGTLEDAAAAGRVLVGAAAASKLRRARLGRLGMPFDGYDSVNVDAECFQAATGVELVAIPADEFTAAYGRATAAETEEVEREVRASFEVEAEAEGEGLGRSFRAAVALESLVRDHALDAGAINCHVPEIRFGRDVGIAPCFALGRMTSAGVPWSCAGDVVTAFAMLAAKLVGASALYHELEVLDYESGEMIIANTGEHDLAFAREASRPKLQRNLWFKDDPICGVCACFSGKPGPATLVAFAQLDAPNRYRLIIAPGEIADSGWPGVGTPNAAFRFRRGAEGWLDWCRAGATHHSSATPGDFTVELEALGRFLGLEVVTV